MKLKNVKIGTRVQLKKDHLYEPSLKRGMKGTILENDSNIPYVSWDNITEGHNGVCCNQVRVALGLPENSVWSVDIKYLKRIK